MKLYSLLPPNRFEAGEFWVEDADGQRIYGPVRCRGEADNSAAAKAGNPDEDPARPYGDHPTGLYRVTDVVEIDQRTKQAATYGPFFIRLNPVAGQAWEARLAGRSGFGAHGGKLHEDGRLRETFGCLRLDDAAIKDVAGMVLEEQKAGREVFYEAREAFSAADAEGVPGA